MSQGATSRADAAIRCLSDATSVDARPGETLDRDTPAWLVSLVVHLVGLVAIAFTRIEAPLEEKLTLTLDATVRERTESPVITEDFVFDEIQSDSVGAMSVGGTEVAMSVAPRLDVVSHSSNIDLPISDIGTLPLQETFDLATGLHVDTNFIVKGAAGVGTTGAMGAIDQLTHEIMMSLDERETLVVWLFDQSASLIRQRQTIHERLGRIYDELGVIQQSGHRSFRKYDGEPLLTSIVAFGEEVTLLTDKPISNTEEIKRIVRGIKRDDSGIENVFQAITMSAEKYKRLRLHNPRGGEPRRNVMLIGFTDEVGDDQQFLDTAVETCRKYEMPVYIVGIPAPFGRKEAIVKWVDPDPTYDQTPGQGEVDQGPESLFPERLKLGFISGGDDLELMDSGFGPYALTRLCYETGGIYFAVHPNRSTARRVRWGDVEAFSAHLTHFFDPNVMRKYQPDYIPTQAYLQKIRENPLREALITAARQSSLAPLDDPRTRFVKRNDADFANALTDAQKAAAKLEPQVEAIYQILKRGEAVRPREQTPRWQAGYDLAMGRMLAMKVRTESYNAMLAAAKQGLRFADANNNTWQLMPNDQIDGGSQLDNLAARARDYLERVTEEHPDTPWALLAQRELSHPLGWRWDESHTNLDPPRPSPNVPNNNPPPPQDDQRRMIERPKVKRPIPKL